MAFYPQLAYVVGEGRMDSVKQDVYVCNMYNVGLDYADGGNKRQRSRVVTPGPGFRIHYKHVPFDGSFAHAIRYKISSSMMLCVLQLQTSIRFMKS